MCKLKMPPLTNTIVKSAIKSALRGDARAIDVLETCKKSNAPDAKQASIGLQYVRVMQARSHVRDRQVKKWMHDAEKGKTAIPRLKAMVLEKSAEQEDAKLALEYLELLRKYLEELSKWKKKPS